MAFHKENGLTPDVEVIQYKNSKSFKFNKK